MNKLPSEIQDIIYNHYWKFQFSNVLNELTKCNSIEVKIKKFLYTYCFNELLFKNEYINNLISFNEDIKSIIKNKNFKYLCYKNNLTLYYCFCDKYKKNVCSTVHENLKYIAMFSISCSGNMRYFILDRFQKLSNLN
tara:strand:- start:3029 stop:3439 length:411 start_codon:yes stop_codon:yes gene_type:complete